jgi:hypothetical protein
MEYALVAAITGIGYLLNRAPVEREARRRPVYDAPVAPNNVNVYRSDIVDAALATQQSMSDARYARSKQPWTTGMVPNLMNLEPGGVSPPITVAPGGATPPMYAANDMEGIQPFGAFDDQALATQWAPTLSPMPSGDRNAQTGGGTERIGPPDRFTPSLQQAPLTHNNMVPFFGGRIKQNTDINKNGAMMESFTGNMPLQEPKVESSAFFSPEGGATKFVNGYYEQERDMSKWIPSLYQQGVKPFQPIDVGRGLCNGPTSKPTGGFHDFYRAPQLNVDQLRVGSKPKQTYKARVLPPKAFNARPTKAVPVSNNRPAKFRTLTQDDLFRTTGAVTQEAPKPDMSATYKVQNRFQSEAYTPAKGPAGREQTTSRAETLPDKRQTFCASGARNLGRSDGWTPKGVSQKQFDTSDYGRSAIDNAPNERSNTTCQTRKLNLRGQVQRESAPLSDVARDTRKQLLVTATTIANAKLKGAREHPVGVVDAVRQTIKETLIHDATVGYFGSSAPNKLTVYSPEEWKPDPTLREVYPEEGDYRKSMLTGSTQASLQQQDGVRTTVRETTEGPFESAILTGDKHASLQQQDGVRTTVRETTEGPYGSAILTGDTRGTLQQQDGVRTTVRETTEGPYGSAILTGDTRATLQQQDGVRTTVRETTESNNYLVQANAGMMQRGLGYLPDVTQAAAKPVFRQFIADTEYTGVASSKDPRHADQTEYNNATTNAVKERIARGRAPTDNAAKVAMGGDGYNANLRREAQSNDYVVPGQRQGGENFGANGTESPGLQQYMSPDACQVTKSSIKLSDLVPDNRLDPQLMDQLRSNPLAISINPR